MAVKKSDKILYSKDEIMEYIGGVSEYMFKKYIESGMPARYEPGSGWIAHCENIDEFFKIYTRISMKNKLQQVLQDENQG